MEGIIFMRLIAFLLLCFFSSLPAADNLFLREGKVHNIWPKNGATVTAGKNGGLVITVPKGGQCNGIVYLNPEWKVIRLSTEMKADNLVPGAESWQCGRVELRFRNADKKEVGGRQKSFDVSGTTGFVRHVHDYEIPAGAVTLSVDPVMYGVSGVVAFRNFKIMGGRSLGELPPPDAEPVLPPVAELWSLDEAYRESSATRERVCLNTVWQFLPVQNFDGGLPAETDDWFYFKVPGIWGSSAEKQRINSAQWIMLSDGRPAGVDRKDLTRAWYRRTVEIPAGWRGKAIGVDIAYLQTSGKIYVNRQLAGEIRFPGGEVDITRFVEPGKTAEILIALSAESDASLAIFVAAPGRTVPNRRQGNDLCGINGDVFLTARPLTGPLLADARIVTKVSDGSIAADVGFSRVAPGAYRLSAEIFDGDTAVKQFVSGPVTLKDEAARITFRTGWQAPKLWDPDHPDHLYTAKITLLRPDGTAADQLEPIEFGFREISIKGRDFYLNGNKLHLRSTLVWNQVNGADHHTEESFAVLAARFREFGLNFALGMNYGFAAGSGTFLDSAYRGLSRNGILFGVTFPRGAHTAPIDRAEYRRQMSYLIRRYQNLPGAILYAGNHNTCGYMGDQNPARFDSYSPDEDLKKYSRRSFTLREAARETEKLIRELDDSRPVYHHEGGNIGDVYTLNCYLNWAPRQERSDWFEHWEKNGSMPVFLVEWGLPYSASYSSYRGPGFIFSVSAPQCLWLSEYDAGCIGEEAYRSNPNKTALYRVQESQASGNRPIRFSQLHWFWENLGAQRTWAYFSDDNFRALRARGVSFAPWDVGSFWRMRAASGKFPNRFDHLKKPGPSPDAYSYVGHEFMSNVPAPGLVVFEAGKLMKKHFAPQTGWIAGRIGDFTEKGHNFRPGETVEKSLVILNDTYASRRVRWNYAVASLGVKESGEITIPAGGRADVPVLFRLPADASGSLELEARFTFDNAPEVTDRFSVTVMPAEQAKLKSRVALIDPDGTAKALCDALKLTTADASQKLPAGTTLLILGRGALGKLPYPLDEALKKGLKLLILEQPVAALEKLGIRADEYGLRELFPVSGSNFTAGLLRDWHGSSTLLTRFLDIEGYENKEPRWVWNGFSVSRVWRAGTRGTVASVIPEKPSVGDFLPLVQGGFDLQYAPVLEFREGESHIILSQLDLSGRSRFEPEALQLFHKMLVRLDAPEKPHRRRTWFCGGAELERMLGELKIEANKLMPDSPLKPEDLVIAGPGANDGRLAGFVGQGGKLLGVGLSAGEIEGIVPGKTELKRRKSFSDFAPGLDSVAAFAGIGNAELHFRKELELDYFPVKSPGGMMLKCVASGSGEAVFCQVAPWHFDEAEFMYRTTRRRNFALIARLAHNLGASSKSDFISRFTGKAFAPDGGLDLTAKWVGVADPDGNGRSEGFFKDTFRPDGKWRPVKVPGFFTSQFAELGNYTGHFWYRRNFDFDIDAAQPELTLFLGGIDDESWVWLNGEFLGEVTKETHPQSFWEFPREYKIAREKLRKRGNNLTILVKENGGGGGILGAPKLIWKPDYRLYTDVSVADDNPYRYYRW